MKPFWRRMDPQSRIRPRRCIEAIDEAERTEASTGERPMPESLADILRPWLPT